MDCQFTTSSPGLTHLASRHISSCIIAVCADVCYYGFVGLRFLADMSGIYLITANKHATRALPHVHAGVITCNYGTSAFVRSTLIEPLTGPNPSLGSFHYFLVFHSIPKSAKTTARRAKRVKIERHSTNLERRLAHSVRSEYNPEYGVKSQ